MRRRCTMCEGVEATCLCILCSICGNGDEEVVVPRTMGMKLIVSVPTGSVSRFAKSKVWQNTEGSSAASPTCVVGLFAPTKGR
jgi:hypothetical protein